MRALIDLDMPAHEIGHVQQETGRTYIDDEGNEQPEMEPVPLDELYPVAGGRLMSILINTAAGSWQRKIKQ